MSHTLHSIAMQIITVAKLLYKRNMLAAADGNISYRINNEQIIITPSGKAKAFITPKEMATITLDNKIISGNPSGERLMHLAIYQHCEKAKCVVHAHPPSAIAWGITDNTLTSLPSESLSELILMTPTIPIVTYARPGTQAMGENLIPYLPELKLFILAHHGALAWGESLEEAWYGMERLEHTADILLRAKTLGNIIALPKKEIEALHALREHMKRTS